MDFGMLEKKKLQKRYSIMWQTCSMCDN